MVDASGVRREAKLGVRSRFNTVFCRVNLEKGLRDYKRSMQRREGGGDHNKAVRSDTPDASWHGTNSRNARNAIGVNSVIISAVAITAAAVVVTLEVALAPAPALAPAWR